MLLGKCVSSVSEDKQQQRKKLEKQKTIKSTAEHVVKKKKPALKKNTPFKNTPRRKKDAGNPIGPTRFEWNEDKGEGYFELEWMKAGRLMDSPPEVVLQDFAAECMEMVWMDIGKILEYGIGSIVCQMLLLRTSKIG